MRRDALFVLLLCAALVAWLAAQVHRPAPETRSLSVTGLLGEAPEDFRRVTGPAPLEFPADHAMHPGYRNEWWYFTGNLEDPAGEPLGWQFTLFRFALDPAPRPDSAWAADAVWMAHLAVSDGRQQRFYSSERFAREALDLAGADPDHWWLKGWTVMAAGNGWQLVAEAEDFAVELQLQPLKPVVLQGEAGYSRKGPERGNASRYYSITRIRTRGTIRLGDEVLAVRGLSWLDREWGSHQLSERLEGWDWFALQLDDGRDAMVYRLRGEDGSASPFSAGVLVEADGSSRYLAADDFETEVLERWRDRQGVRWPVAWQVRIPGADLDLQIRALFNHQRWYGAVDYWEGAVKIQDSATGESLGRGYLELSGYAN